MHCPEEVMCHTPIQHTKVGLNVYVQLVVVVVIVVLILHVYSSNLLTSDMPAILMPI